MSGTSVLGIVEFLNSSAVMRLNIAKLAQDSPARWTLPRLGVRSAHKIAQPIDSAATSAFENGWKRHEAHHCRSTNDVAASIVLLPRVRKAAPKSVIWPLKEEVRDGVEYGVLVYVVFLEFNSSDLAKPVLVVFKHSSW
jgi:hypothetical protein